MRTSGAFWLAVLLATTAPLDAQVRSPVERARQDREAAETAEKWRVNINRQLDELRKPGRDVAAKVEKRLRGLYDDMLRRVGEGSFGRELVGYTLLGLAVAEARLGREADAAWDWLAAQNIAPELSRRRFTVFDDVAGVLEAHRIEQSKWLELEAKRAERAAGGEPEDTSARVGLTPDGGIIIPPTVVKKVPPVYPEGARQFRLQRVVTVEVVIDMAGVPRDPFVISGCEAVGFCATALDAVRQWRYAPATRDGKPVEVYMTIDVTYRLE